jgi:hypothetical protein
MLRRSSAFLNNPPVKAGGGRGGGGGGGDSTSSECSFSITPCLALHAEAEVRERYGARRRRHSGLLLALALATGHASERRRRCCDALRDEREAGGRITQVVHLVLRVEAMPRGCEVGRHQAESPLQLLVAHAVAASELGGEGNGIERSV